MDSRSPPTTAGPLPAVSSCSLSTARRCLRPTSIAGAPRHSSAAGAEIDTVRDHAERLVQAARERLLRWDLSDADIRALEERARQ